MTSAGAPAAVATAHDGDGRREPSPAFLHVGFRAAEPADVRALLARMEGDGVPIVERNEEAACTAFKCLDPDGHRIEVYWEP